jgi:hypothetical protein
MADTVKALVLISGAALIVLFWATSNPKSAEEVREKVTHLSGEVADSAKDLADNLTDDKPQGSE